MKKNFNFISLDWIVILCFGLVPLLWFRAPGFIISGDMLPPIGFENFINRFFAWDERLGGGHEALLHYSALFFYFIEACLTSFLPNLIIVQKVEFMLWFLLPGLSIYYLLSVILQGEGKRWGRLIGVTFYMFNLYLEPIWQGMNIANLSSYVFVPLMLAIVIQGLEKKGYFWFSVFTVSLLTFLAAPIGSNPPMLMASLIPFALYFLFFIFRQKVWRNREDLVRLVSFLGLTLLLSFLVNLFWIIPFIDQIFVNSAGTSLEFTPDSAFGWLKGISKNTSLLNVARMQGAWVWYEEHVEPYAPYAVLYQKNLFFVFLGYLLPVLACSGFYFNRSKKGALFFCVLALVGIVLGTGIHSPFGNMYKWLVTHVPFFYTVRSPWYKFTLLTCIGYAGLFAFLGQFISNKREEFQELGKKVLARCLYVVLFLLMGYQWVYAFPVTFGKMFFTSQEREYMTHNFMDVPRYVETALDQFQNESGFFRVIEVSPKLMQEYEWGNFGFNHPLTHFTTVPVFYGSMVNSPSLYPSDQITHIIHQAIKNKKQVAPLLRFFNIRYLIYPMDLHWYRMEEIKQAAQIREFLEQCPGLELEKRVGPWVIYRVQLPNKPVIEFAQNPIFVWGHFDQLPAIAGEEIDSFVFVNSSEDLRLFPLSFRRNLLLINMGLEELMASELASKYQVNPSYIKKQNIPFTVPESGDYEIWVRASGEALSQPLNIYLDDIQPLKVKNDILQGTQWGKIYDGSLTQGPHALYVRNLIGDMGNVVIFPKKAKKEILTRILKEVKGKMFYIQTKEDALIKKEKILWLRDSFVENKGKIEFQQAHEGFAFFQQKRWLILRFSKELKKADPSVIVSMQKFDAYSLSDYPDIRLDYDMPSPKFYQAKIRFHLQSKGKIEMLTLPLEPFIPLYKEWLLKFPQQKEVRCVGLDFILSHSYENRLGYQRYPSYDFLLSKISVERNWLSHQTTADVKMDHSNMELDLAKLPKSQFLSGEFIKKNPVHYEVNIKEPFQGVLVLNQAYHPRWIAQDSKGNLLKHVKVNDWANGFIATFSKSEKCMIYFNTQKKVNYGLWVSGLSLLLILFLMIFSRRRSW